MEKLGIATIFIGGGLVGAGIVVNLLLLPNPAWLVYDLLIGAMTIFLGYEAITFGMEEKFKNKYFPNRMI